MEVGGQNVIKENREYQVKKDDRNIRESVRENETEAGKVWWVRPDGPDDVGGPVG